MLLIFTSENTRRLQYTLQLIFAELLDIRYDVTTDVLQFQSYNGAKLNYSKGQQGDGIFIYASELLFETGIRKHEIDIGLFENIKTLFHHDHESDLAFDPFAASFYLVSRYEEYLPFQPDEHGRFPEEQSLNVKAGFFETPVVNHYALFLRQLLQSHYPELSSTQRKFEFRLTYDIDMAFAFREKGMLRNAGGLIKSIARGEVSEGLLRTKVLTGARKDPFDTFSYQFALHEKNNLSPVYFFLLGDQTTFDKNIHWENPVFDALIREISAKYDVGIHSSYASNDVIEKVREEIGRLEKITEKKIIRNRQHFLRLRFPATYRTLQACGIEEDYTMGYSSLAGFRAGIASSFLFYDLEKEEVTTLRVFPFAVMDATLHYYQHLSPKDALNKSLTLLNAVRRVSGTFIFLAHNDLISEEGPWKGWKAAFEEWMTEAAG